jgi:hypothetical protein
MEIHEDYPRKGVDIMNYYDLYWERGEKVNYFCINGAEDKYLKT